MIHDVQPWQRFIIQKYLKTVAQDDDPQTIPNARFGFEIQGSKTEKFRSTVWRVSRQVNIVIVAAAQSEDITAVSVAAAESGPDLDLARTHRGAGAEAHL